MRKKLIVLIFLAFISSQFSVCVAQTQPLTRAQLQNYTNSSIYQNPTHAISGQSLQNTFSNYNSSCANLRTDTMFVLLFDSNYTYYFGMKVIIPPNFTIPQPVLQLNTQFQVLYTAPPNPPSDSSFFKTITRCDTARYKGPFDTIHFKPILYGNWNNY